jgi:hypothetical protein
LVKLQTSPSKTVGRRKRIGRKEQDQELATRKAKLGYVPAPLK